MIKFISYTGKYPNLCSGVLTVEIDGKDWDMWAKHAPWEVNGYWDNANEKHPQWVIDILPNLLKVFNENVPYGCCGGCI